MQNAIHSILNIFPTPSSNQHQSNHQSAYISNFKILESRFKFPNRRLIFPKSVQAYLSCPILDSFVICWRISICILLDNPFVSFSPSAGIYAHTNYLLFHFFKEKFSSLSKNRNELFRFGCDSVHNIILVRFGSEKIINSVFSSFGWVRFWTEPTECSALITVLPLYVNVLEYHLNSVKIKKQKSKVIADIV